MLSTTLFFCCCSPSLSDAGGEYIEREYFIGNVRCHAPKGGFLITLRGCRESAKRMLKVTGSIDQRFAT